MGYLRSNRGRQTLKQIEMKIRIQIDPVDDIESTPWLCDELKRNPKVTWHEASAFGDGLTAIEHKPVYPMVKDRKTLIDLIYSAELNGIVWDDLSDAYDTVDDDLRVCLFAGLLVCWFAGLVVGWVWWCAAHLIR